MSENLIPIPGRLHSVASEGHVAGADEIIDDDFTIDGTTGQSQADINSYLDGKDPLPSQSGNSGKFLTTDGSDVSWGSVDLSSKADKLPMTGEGAATENNFMAIDANGNIKDSGKKESDFQAAITDNAQIGNGIGTCSTAAATAAKTVSITDFELTKNASVAVTFENNVLAGATLNVSGTGAKPIFFKGAAIVNNIIKGGDTITFCYDGTNYIVTGKDYVQVNEIAVISLESDESSYDSDLIGATVTVTDDDTDEVILATTWQGTPIECEIEIPTNYTVSVGDVATFTTPSDQSYSSKTTRTRNIVFEYIYQSDKVNLGLPSGRIWATGNVVQDGNSYKIGAETDYGAYISWGNVDPHFSTNLPNIDGGYSFTSEVYESTPGAAITGEETSEAAFAPNSGYDAARELLGGQWRLPTKTDFEELVQNCNSDTVTKDGVAGRELTSKINGRKIFFPYAGYGLATTIRNYGVNGYYWTSSMSTDNFIYYFYVRVSGVLKDNRYSAETFRAVM